MQEKYFKKIFPKSVIIPTMKMKIKFKNTSKISSFTILIKDENDIDKAKNIFIEKYKSHDPNNIDSIDISLDQFKAPLLATGNIDFNDKDDLDNTFFAFSVVYAEFKNDNQK